MQPPHANTHTASCLKALRRTCGLLLAFLVLAIGLAAPDLDKMQTLAQQRYGTPASETVAAWRKLMIDSRPLSDLEKLNKVNAFFNRRMLYETDLAIWQQEDYWATPLELMGRAAGDCEDLAIAKYITLLLLGVNNQNLRLIYVRAKVGASSVAHMVLGYYPQPAEEPACASPRNVPTCHPSSASTTRAYGRAVPPPRPQILRRACHAGVMCLSACVRMDSEPLLIQNLFNYPTSPPCHSSNNSGLPSLWS